MSCTLGVDFGTLSARAIVVDTRNGNILGEQVFEYPHGVITEKLPGGHELPDAWALQNPADYLEALKITIRGAVDAAKADPSAICGLGIDFTCCTLLPVDAALSPLCFRQSFCRNGHAYPKLWKHHAAQPFADYISKVARQRNEKFLTHYCGYISPEWAVPKILEIYCNAPEISAQATYYMEAGDWLVSVLTGELIHSSSFAAYKSLWNSVSGYPSNEFFETLAPGFSSEIKKHTAIPVRVVGTRAGRLNKKYAELLGLCPDIPVAVPSGDAYAAIIGSCVLNAGDMVLVLGTSACNILLSNSERDIQGIDSVLKDAIVPGLYAYEAGQFGTGDALDWFVKHIVPEHFSPPAANTSEVHRLLSERAAALSPGESGLLALEWFNGNRSILKNASLSGAIIGLRMSTKPEEIYRSIIEASAFGQKVIFDALESGGLPIKSVTLCGGIARKNAFLTQLYSDVLGRELYVNNSTQSSALGAAIYASVAAGSDCGGYDLLTDACNHMKNRDGKWYYPDAQNHKWFERVYALYRDVHDYFGSTNDLMAELRILKNQVRGM